MATGVRASLAAIFLACAVSVGCSSGTGNASGTSGGATCDELCSEGTSLPCATKTQSECVSSCQADVSQKPAQCASVYVGGMLCVTKAFGCNSGTVTGADVLAACPSEMSAYAGCMACEPEASDDACDKYKKTSCCAARKAAFSDPDAMSYAACVSSCPDATCATACGDKYPGGLKSVQAYADCTSASCSGC